MPAAQKDKSEVVEAITRTFQELGYDGSSLTTLAKRSGLMKASLYHYFPDGKLAMADVAFDTFAKKVAENVLAPLQSGLEPKQRLLAALNGFSKVYGGGTELCLFSLLSIGEGQGHFKPKIKAVVATLIEALGKTLCECGLRKASATVEAERLIVEIEGAVIVSRLAGDSGVFRRTLKRLRDHLEQMS